MVRSNSGDQKIIFGMNLSTLNIWSDDVWKSKMAGGGGNEKIFYYCIDPSGQELLYLRALQGRSGRNPIDLTLQDNVLMQDNSSSTFIILDVQISSLTLHRRFRIDIGWTKILAGKDIRCSLRL